MEVDDIFSDDSSSYSINNDDEPELSTDEKRAFSYHENIH